MTTNNSGVSVTVLLSVLCLGITMMFVGGWYFKSSLDDLKTQQQEFEISLFELKAQKQETAQIMQQLKEKVRKQSKQINELCSQLEMRQFKVSSNSIQ